MSFDLRSFSSIVNHCLETYTHTHTGPTKKDSRQTAWSLRHRACQNRRFEHASQGKVTTPVCQQHTANTEPAVSSIAVSVAATGHQQQSFHLSMRDSQDHVVDYLHTKWHPNPSNCLATIRQRHRQDRQTTVRQDRENRFTSGRPKTVFKSGEYADHKPEKSCSNSAKLGG